MGTIGVDSTGVLGEDDREEDRELEGEIGEERDIAVVIGVALFRSPISEGIGSVA